MEYYTIKKTSEMTGLSEVTLRYYDKEGLFPYLNRKNGYRLFSKRELDAIKFIGCLKSGGADIKTIKKYMDLYIRGDETLRQRQEIIIDQYNLLLEKRKELNKSIDLMKRKIAYYEKAIELGSEESIKDLDEYK